MDRPRSAEPTEPDPLVTTWRKSSASSSGGGDGCVEIALTPTSALVRDSKDSQGPRLTVSMPAWTAFLDGLRHE